MWFSAFIVNTFPSVQFCSSLCHFTFSSSPLLVFIFPHCSLLILTVATLMSLSGMPQCCASYSDVMDIHKQNNVCHQSQLEWMVIWTNEAKTVRATTEKKIWHREELAPRRAPNVQMLNKVSRFFIIYLAFSIVIEIRNYLAQSKHPLSDLLTSLKGNSTMPSHATERLFFLAGSAICPHTCCLILPPSC